MMNRNTKKIPNILGKDYTQFVKKVVFHISSTNVGVVTNCNDFDLAVSPFWLFLLFSFPCQWKFSVSLNKINNPQSTHTSFVNQFLSNVFIVPIAGEYKMRKLIRNELHAKKKLFLPHTLPKRCQQADQNKNNLLKWWCLSFW